MPIANGGPQVCLDHTLQCQNKVAQAPAKIPVKAPVNDDLNNDLLLARQPGEVGGIADALDKIIWHILFY